MAESTPAVSTGFAWRDTPAGRTLVSLALEPFAPHGFTTRDLSFLRDTIDEDYARLGAVFGRAGQDVVRVRQVHGRDVLRVFPGESLDAVPDADAIVSSDASRVVSVRTADCVPILVADRHRRVVAAIHAGWRGTAVAVAAATVETIAGLGVPASDLVVAIGPSIGACCYQVDGTVHRAFHASQKNAAAWFAADGTDRWRLDLVAANRWQLEAAGVAAEAISAADRCSFDAPKDWYSFRREGSGGGRMVAAIRLAAPMGT